MKCSDYPEYEAFALRYATLGSRMASENHLMPPRDDGPMPLDFYMWVIRSRSHTIVIDCGFGPEVAKIRQRTLLHSPLELLALINVDAASVRHVILTHTHYDHIGNLGLFPQAQFYLQEAEMAFSTGRSMTHAHLRRPFELGSILELVQLTHAGRVTYCSDTAEIAPGVSVHLVGGHTPGMQVVRVPTARGWVVLASDATHYWANIGCRSPFPIVVDLPQMLEGYGIVEALADGPDHIIPGHDPDVRERFLQVPEHPDIVMLHKPPAVSRRVPRDFAA